MKLHTVFIAYNRLELTQIAVSSYLETVSRPFTAVVFDNASTDGTQEWLLEHCPIDFILSEINRYPGFACNTGWETAPGDADFLHRADNDFAFLPGWCDEVEERFDADPKLAQLGMRTDEEEMFAEWNVGGNCVLSREAWDSGLRYDERPWTEFPEGYTEDSFFTPEVVKAGFNWGRVKVPCIRPTSREDPDDPYYRGTWADRGINDFERPE